MTGRRECNNWPYMYPKITGLSILRLVDSDRTAVTVRWRKGKKQAQLNCCFFVASWGARTTNKHFYRVQIWGVAQGQLKQARKSVRCKDYRMRRKTVNCKEELNFGKQNKCHQMNKQYVRDMHKCIECTRSRQFVQMWPQTDNFL